MGSRGCRARSRSRAVGEVWEGGNVSREDRGVGGNGGDGEGWGGEERDK